MSREGSVKRDSSGRWGFVVDLTPPGAAKRRQLRRRGFRTKAEALTALDEAKAGMRAGTWVPKTRQTSGQFLEEWVKTAAPSLRPATIYSYKRNLQRHVVPRIGHVPLQELDAGHLNQLYAELLEPGANLVNGGPLSARTVGQIATVLKAALSDAERWGRVVRNPASMANPPRPAGHLHRPMVTWSAEQLNVFLTRTAQDGDRDAPLWRLLASTGCRRGEALGLRWGDVDLDARTMSISQTVIAVGHVPMLGSPKTRAGARTVDLDPGTVSALREHRKRQAVERLLVGVGWKDNGLVFCGVDGGVLHPENVSGRFVNRVKAYGLPRLSLHGLRHTWATLALRAGVHPRVVQERLGHATIAITLGTYSHVTAGMGREAAELVAGLFDGL